MNRLLILPLLLTAVSSLQAQLSYARISVPGAVATEARGVSNSGEIVGFYKTVACTDTDITVPNCPTKGFKYVNKTYVKLMVPNSKSTAIMGVNDLGDLVGFYVKSDGTSHGFLWLHTNVIKNIDFPDFVRAGFPTVPMAINKAGTIVGGLWRITLVASFPVAGFVWKNGTFTEVQFGTSPDCCTSVNGISNSGITSGEFDHLCSICTSIFTVGFLKAGKDFDFFKYQGGNTRFTGVNNNTDILGFAFAGQFGRPTIKAGFWAKHIEWGEGTNDSNEVKPAFMLLSFPAGHSTVPFAINDASGIVGTYVDSSGQQQGFLAK
jgi:uncharacterized membrane protein